MATGRLFAIYATPTLFANSTTDLCTGLEISVSFTTDIAQTLGSYLPYTLHVSYKCIQLWAARSKDLFLVCRVATDYIKWPLE